MAYNTGVHPDPYPVGSIFLSVVTTNPKTLLGYGTWELLTAGQMLMTANTTDTTNIGKAEGSNTKSVPLLSHNHSGPSHSHAIYVNNCGEINTRGRSADHTHAIYINNQPAFGTTGASANHTHSFTPSGTISSAGSHSHNIHSSGGDWKPLLYDNGKSSKGNVERKGTAAGNAFVTFGAPEMASFGYGSTQNQTSGSHSHTFTGNAGTTGYISSDHAHTVPEHGHSAYSGGESVDHYHTVPEHGHSASSGDAGTGATGSAGTANATMDVTNAHIKVYAWKRTA